MTETQVRQVLPLIEQLSRAGRRAYEGCSMVRGLRPRHIIVLNVLHERGPLGQQALGELLTLDPSNVVGLLNELEERGLIARDRDPADRRRHIVSLSPAGREELAASGELFAEVEDIVLAALTPAERATLHDLLSRAVCGTEADASPCLAAGPCTAPGPRSPAPAADPTC
ncbi:MAG TPA: MarR family winged helix-turn-helix transcriptional regulator [Trebonia sp.]|jgi:DNA-binding MarR family transcriptional regulator|nr:MarR family winged helix-turn-helix transcriptional regulator [Trebonia sp.]